LFTGDGFIIDRLQTSNVNPNIPLIPVYEIGNEQKLATIRDTPDLSFDVESYDVSPKFEAILLGLNPGSLTAGQQLDPNTNQPLSVLSPFRSSLNLYTIPNGAIVPHLGLEQINYRFGINDEASQSYTLRGDSIYYTPGSPYEDTFTSDGATNHWTLTKTAQPYVNPTLGQTQYTVNLSVYNPDGTFYRLFAGAGFDYTDTSTTVTLNAGVPVPITGATIKVQYSSATIQTIPASSNTADGISVKPAGIRAKDITVWVGNGAATPTYKKWSGIQSFDMTWRVNLDANKEFGNPQVLSHDYVTANVDGTITTRDNTLADLFSKIYQATNVSAGDVIGALSSTPLEFIAVLHNPDTGAPLKSIYVPDAVFTPPQINARVNQKLETPFKFYSNSGLMYIYNGVPAWATGF
jgi:hypothetical protein